MPAYSSQTAPQALCSGILDATSWGVRQSVMSLSRYAQPRGLHVGAGVHVRLTESLNASCNLHLELSGSRAKPTAARREVIIPPGSHRYLSRTILAP